MVPYKFPNAASHKIAVTGTAANLLDLIETAAGATIDFPYDLSMAVITPEDGSIRLSQNGIVPTAAMNRTRTIANFAIFF